MMPYFFLYLALEPIKIDRKIVAPETESALLTTKNSINLSEK